MNLNDIRLPQRYPMRHAMQQLRRLFMSKKELRKSMKYWRKHLRIAEIGLLFVCPLKFLGCANHCVDIPPKVAIPEYLYEPCAFPEPRPVETQEDELRLLTDFSNDLENCAIKHDLLVKFAKENSIFLLLP